MTKMNLEVYPWDKKQQQEKDKPYGFVDFPANFLDIFQEKREEALNSIKIYSDKELVELEEFETPKVIATLYQTISKNKDLTQAKIKHFWRILKKVEVRKLTFSYNANFINTTKNPLSLKSYVYLSLVFLLYSKSKKQGYLQALSTALKLNDLLISEQNNLDPLTQYVLLSALQLEQEQIKSLMNEIKTRPIKNVTLPESYRKDPSRIIENLGMLLQETNRSKAYLQKLINSGLLPNFVLLLRKPGKIKETLDSNPEEINTQYFNPLISEEKSLQQAGIPYKIIQVESCNEELVVSSLKQRPEQYFIFSGRGILKETFEAGKKLIHSHPGKIPKYRGSTCPYYSALAGDGWHCTSFIMRPEVDKGEVITGREFPLPKARVDATRIYDPYSRAEVIIDVVRQLAETGKLETTQQDLSKGITYYIIHPVLEFMAKQFFENQSSN